MTSIVHCIGSRLNTCLSTYLCILLQTRSKMSIVSWLKQNAPPADPEAGLPKASNSAAAAANAAVEKVYETEGT